MDPGTALITSAKGDFIYTVIAVFVIFALGLCGFLVNWITKTIPAQMEKDRQAIQSQMKEDRVAQCDKMSELITTFREVFKQHDDQARKILQTDERIEVKLDSRPCAAKS